MFLYAVSRYIIEIYRGDPRGMVFDTFSTSQFISLILAPLAVAMLWRLSRHTPEPAIPRRKRAAA
jgi:prolipoprotein diacylglyceryltransferase